VQDAVGPAGENDNIDHALAQTAINNLQSYHCTIPPLLPSLAVGLITVSRWLRMYQISQTSFNPDTADQPTAFYAAYSADYRGDAMTADGRFSHLHISRPPTLWRKMTFSTHALEYTVSG